MRLQRLLATLPLRLREIFRRSRVEQELDDEIRDHIERRVADDVARGVDRDEARQAAVRAFGGVAQVKEASRDLRGGKLLEHTMQDVRSAIRHFARAPIASVTMIGMFALGIGFSAALFMFVEAFANGRLPGVPSEESLVRIRGIDRTEPNRGVGREFSYSEYREYASQQALFSGVAAWTSSDVILDVGAPGDPNLQSGAATYVAGHYFQVLGLRPAVGAGLPTNANDADPAPALVAVISHTLWERHFERSTDVIGQSMKVNGVPFTIAGVAPRRFAGARTGGSAMRVWLPLNTRAQVQQAPTPLTSYDEARFGLVARLQPGVRFEDTVPTVTAIAARAAQQMTAPQVRPEQTTPAQPMATGALISADVAPLLANNYFPPAGLEEPAGAGPWIALLFPFLVLLITCTNVSALLAGLGVARRREIAVRLALGASRRRVVRQLVTETVMLAVAAGALGLFVIWLLLRLFDANIPDIAIEIDARSIVFTCALALMAGLLFGYSPALHSTRLSVQEALKDSAGLVVTRRLRLQSWLVVAQIAFTQPALLSMGALFLEMQSDLRALPSQPFADRLVELRFNVNPRYGAIDANREQTLTRLQDRLAGVPGVEGVVKQESVDVFDIDVHPDDAIAGRELTSPQQVRGTAAPAGYFRMMGLSFVRGRDFEAGERPEPAAVEQRVSGRNEIGPTAPVGEIPVVIGRGLARHLWGGDDAIGKRVVSVGRNLRNAQAFVIVGVVDDARGGGEDSQGRTPVFMPNVHTTGHLLVRTSGLAEPMLPTIRRVAAEEAPGLPVTSARTLAAIESAERGSYVNAISAAGGVGILALLLSAIGLYAVVAFAVNQRVREIGIRAALGADSRQVVRMFVRHGLRLCFAGLAIGLALGLAGVRVFSNAQGSEPPTGMLTLAALVATFVIGVALLASWIPARRASRIDPLVALRIE